MGEKILVTGPFGQVGSDLVPKLQEMYGVDNVVALGHRNIPEDFQGVLEKGDIRCDDTIGSVVKKHGITQIYHLASLLSAVGEQKPDLAWDINMNGLKVFLDVCKDNKIKLFWPSSIAVFGPTTPRENTPQRTILEPTSMYGVSKVAGEVLCNYYNHKYGLDVRGLRYPGIVSYKQEAGGGTTDYAVAIFYEALLNKKYTCFVKEDTVLPMMYMDDAVKGTIDIMEADGSKLTVRTSYNHAAISFSAKELADEIKKHIPEFECGYEPDFRQAIADSWPSVIDDSQAREDWNWSHDFDLPKMTKEMLDRLSEKLGVTY